MTEPDAGSDVRGMKCFAKSEGNDWLVNGTKHFISGAEHADFVIVFIATGEENTPKGTKKLITCFLVDRETPGFEIRNGYNSVSHRGYQNCILNFDNCKLHKSKILGELHKGFEVANEWHTHKYPGSRRFNKTKKNNHFMGGKKVKEPSIFLLGQIRAGRTKNVKDKLISELKNILVKKSKLDETQVWVYINDLPPSQMIEYGAVLPESGKESEWFKNLSSKLRKKLSNIEKN